MPRTRIQELTFSVIMVILMVFCMTVYNSAHVNGLSYGCFWEALLSMWPEAIAAFILVELAGNPLVKRLLHFVIDTDTAKPTAVAVARAGLTAFFMCPAMTLFVTIFHNGLTSQTPLIWLHSIIVNFPFALLLQIFYLGPLVRFLFRLIFRIRPNVPERRDA